MLTFDITENSNTLRIDANGKLHHSDYQKLTPEVEKLIAKHDKIRIIIVTDDFHGWDLQAAWDDLKLGLKHHKSIERFALVGDKKWMEWLSKSAAWMINGEVKFFEKPQQADAEAWIIAD